MDASTFKGGVDDIAVALQNCDNFAFSRWGDGEWTCMMKPGSGANCDRHQYFTTLSDALVTVLQSNPSYILGMQPKAVRDLGKDINQWLADRNLCFNWANADIFHTASEKDELDEFGYALKTRRIVMVGPKRLKPMAIRFRAHLVEVPLVDCWKWYRQIYTNICDQLDENVVVLYSAGMTSNVLIHHIWNDCGDKVTQIDLGSLWEPYLGIATRRYHIKVMDRLGFRGDKGE